MSEPAGALHDSDPEIMRQNARWGLVLFAIYLALFGGFVYLNIVHPELMGKTTLEWGGTPEDHEGGRELSLGGLNVAVIYGMVLIFAAIALALYYMRVTRAIAREVAAKRAKGERG